MLKINISQQDNFNKYVVLSELYSLAILVTSAPQFSTVSEQMSLSERFYVL